MAFRSITSIQQNAGSGAGNPGLPAGVVAGDTLIAFYTVDGTGAGNLLPTGFTLGSVDNVTNGDQQTVGWGWKVAVGADNTAFTNPGASSFGAFVIAYSGRTGTPIDGTPSDNNPNSVTPPSSPVTCTGTGITTTGIDDVLLLASVDTNGANGTWSPGGSLTQRGAITSAASFCAAAAFDFTQSSAGATGNQTCVWTQSGAAGNFVAYVIGLLPAGGAPATVGAPITRGEGPGRGPGKTGARFRQFRLSTQTITPVALTGTAITLSPAVGAIGGSGALLGAAITLSPAIGLLGGSGSLSGAGIALSPAIASLLGSGALAGSAVTLSPAWATLGGAIALSGAALTLTPATGQLIGSGALSGVGIALSPSQGSLQGAGLLQGVSITLSPSIGNLQPAPGAGALTGVAWMLSPAIGALRGAGALNGTAATLSPAIGALGGAGALAGVGVTLSLSVAPLTGTSPSSLSGAAIALSAARGTLAGAGSLSGAGLTLSPALAQISASVSIAGRGIALSVSYGTILGQPIQFGGPRYIVKRIAGRPFSVTEKKAYTVARPSGRAFSIAHVYARAFTIARQRSRLFTVSALSQLRFDTLEPSTEAYPLTFDFTPDLNTGETVTSITSVTISVVFGTDPSPSNIFNGSPSIDPTNKKVIVGVKNALVNVDYQIIVTVATSNALKNPVLVGVLPVRL